jgi:hypothetical protein
VAEAQVGALERARVERLLALARRLGGRAVPELGVRVHAAHRPGQRVLIGVEDDERARVARQAQPPRLHGGDPVRHRLADPRERGVGDPRRVDGRHARGGQQVLGALAHRALLERRGQQQQAQRALVAEQVRLLADPREAEHAAAAPRQVPPAAPAIAACRIGHAATRTRRRDSWKRTAS